ncbi:MAG: hypothetical protein JXR97_08160 [Planctomycetes bacterium]|nr:hypothetical protein [Planctomycetota bacterium]
MESFEVIKDAVDKVGAKRVAADVEVSTSLVYKWCEQAKSNPSDEKSGARNPLDRIVALMESTGDITVIAWLCEQANGFFVENPTKLVGDFNSNFVSYTQNMIKEFSDVLRVMTESIQNDNVIYEDEAARIRKEWEDLKRYTESFVVACEQGVFNKRK